MVSISCSVLYDPFITCLHVVGSEDDNDRSEDDEDERLDFSVNSKEKERRHIQTTILAAEEGKAPHNNVCRSQGSCNVNVDMSP